MDEIINIILKIIASITLPIFSFIGINKYLIEPIFIAKNNRKKYATALYITCEELRTHYSQIRDSLEKNDNSTIDALMKLPDADFNNDPSWFTKNGYYTTITAYKIASVAAMLKIYQNSLLFSGYQKKFLLNLYEKSQNLKKAFSENTYFWYYYFDAVGEKIIDTNKTGELIITFPEFCEYYSKDASYRLFFDQIHMYIYFIAKKEVYHWISVSEVMNKLQDLTEFLNNENLLSGVNIDRPLASLGNINK